VRFRGYLPRALDAQRCTRQLPLSEAATLAGCTVWPMLQ
jgi:hypothetical protein